MKTTNLLWTVCILLMVGFAAVAATLRGIYDDNRRLLAEIQALRADSQRAAEEIKQLENQKADLAAELASKRDQLQDAQTEPAEAKETNIRTNEVVVSPSTPRPVRVRTFLGNRYVGMSWLAPSGISKNPKTGAVTYEPVLVLDETVKQSLVVYETNVVEREVARSTTVNYNYPWPLLALTSRLTAIPDNCPARLRQYGCSRRIPNRSRMRRFGLQHTRRFFQR